MSYGVISFIHIYYIKNIIYHIYTYTHIYSDKLSLKYQKMMQNKNQQEQQQIAPTSFSHSTPQKSNEKKNKSIKKNTC